MTVEKRTKQAIERRGGLPVLAVVVTTAIALTACRSSETRVKIGWDVPATLPDGYRVFVDQTLVLDTPPPPADPSCNCLALSITLPQGPHSLEVLAYNRGGVSPRSMFFIPAANDLGQIMNQVNHTANWLIDRLAVRWRSGLRFIRRHTHGWAIATTFDAA